MILEPLVGGRERALRLAERRVHGRPQHGEALTLRRRDVRPRERPVQQLGCLLVPVTTPQGDRRGGHRIRVGGSRRDEGRLVGPRLVEATLGVARPGPTRERGRGPWVPRQHRVVDLLRLGPERQLAEGLALDQRRVHLVWITRELGLGPGECLLCSVPAGAGPVR